jgi:raffinose/stachyose/melibiose transport system permease protein
VHGLLLLFALLAIAPVLVIVLNSFKTTPATFADPFGLPDRETFSVAGYERVLDRGNFAANHRNSLVVTVGTTAPTLVLSTLAAFALVEYNVRLAPVRPRSSPSASCSRSASVPSPILKLVVSWRLMDTLTALILVYTAMSVPLAVALMMTHFRAVPTDLKDAGRIDGRSRRGRVSGPRRGPSPWRGSGWRVASSGCGGRSRRPRLSIGRCRSVGARGPGSR